MSLVIEVDTSRIFDRAKPTIFGVLLAFGIGAVMIFLAGANPLNAYSGLIGGAFGDLYRFSETILKTVPLLLAGLGAIVAFRSGVWNIGLEGQIVMGSAAAAWLALFIPGVPSPILILLLMAIGFLAGAGWGLIPGFLKAKFNTNEIFTTIMLNSIAILFATYLVVGPMRDMAAIYPRSHLIPASAQLPILIPGTRFHAGLIIALVCAVIVYAILWKTSLGYTLRTVGLNKKAATYSGISVRKSIVVTMFISGGLAGLAGMGEVSGVHYYLGAGLTTTYGYTAVVVALMGKMNPFATIISAFLFSALLVGADSMQRTAGISSTLVYVIQGLVIITVLVAEILFNEEDRKWLLRQLRLKRS